MEFLERGKEGRKEEKRRTVGNGGENDSRGGQNKGGCATEKTKEGWET